MLAGVALPLGIGARVPIVVWLLPLYWTTLIALVVLIVRALKAAPMMPHENAN